MSGSAAPIVGVGEFVIGALKHPPDLPAKGPHALHLLGLTDWLPPACGGSARARSLDEARFNVTIGDKVREDRPRARDLVIHGDLKDCEHGFKVLALHGELQQLWRGRQLGVGGNIIARNIRGDRNGSAESVIQYEFRATHTP